MTAEQAIALLHQWVDNPPATTYMHTALPQILAALSPQHVWMPTEEGWWWECAIPGVTPKDKPWVARNCEKRNGVMCWWGDGEWVPCRPGHWVRCLPPAPASDGGGNS